MNNPLSYTDPTGYSSVSANDPAYNPATGDIYYPNTNSWLNFDPQTFGSKNGNSGFFSLNLPKLDLGSDYLQNTQLGEAGSWGFGNTADGQSNYSGAGFYSSIGPTPYNFYTDNIIGRILSDFVSPLELFTDNHLNPLSHMDNNVSRVDAAMAIIALGIGTEEKGVAIGLKGFTSGQLGRAGEELASQITGVGKNFRSWFVNGRARIPDQVLAQDIATRNPLIVVEVKNVRYQSLTRQLRDYTDLVGPGGRVDVMLPPGARVSGPLQRAFDNPVSPLSRVDLLAP